MSDWQILLLNRKKKNVNFPSNHLRQCQNIKLYTTKVYMQQEIYLHCKHPRFLSPDVTEKNTWWKVEHVFLGQNCPSCHAANSITHTHTTV